MIAFKALAYSDTAASSKKGATKRVGAKGIASGTYTFWTNANATGIATQTADNAATSVADCLARCDAAEACAGVVMPSSAATSLAASLTAGQCVRITGITTLNTWQRSGVRAQYTLFDALT